ncbi:MAG: isocitrate dehydrogenase kinase/phosphatase-domain containing protein, partial [Bacteroidota bacterium]
YDYDEICFLTECNFRRIPEPRDDEDEYAAGAWFSVGENDIFPEEFRRFLIGRKEVRQMFLEIHGDIFDVTFWREMQDKQRRGEIVDVFPYRRKKRFLSRESE